MKNFPLINPKDGKEYWVSRSIAVVVFLFAIDEKGKRYILATKRGKGTPDPEFVGTYCVPCGYLDYNETTLQAAMRELKEETGITVSESLFKLADVIDNPESDKRQNVSFRYVVDTNLPIEDLQKKFTTKDSEKDEVEDIRFIPILDIDSYKWAFNHAELIQYYSRQ